MRNLNCSLNFLKFSTGIISCFRSISISNHVKTSRIVSLLFLMLILNQINAATITSTATGGNWSSTGTWIGGVVPSAADDAVVAIGATVTVDLASATCLSLTVNDGKGKGTATLDFISSGAGTLSVLGNVIVGNSTNKSGSLLLTNTGILKIGGSVTVQPNSTLTTSAGTVDYYGNSAQTIFPNTYNNLSLSGTGTKDFPAGTTTVNGILSVENGSAANTFTGTLAYGASATLKYNTSSARTAGAEWISTFTATGGVILASTGSVTLNSAKIMGSNSNVPLNINSGAALTTNNLSLTFHGDFINNGTLNAGSSNVLLTGTTATQNIGGFTTTGTVSMTKTAGTATFTGNVTGIGLTINGSGGTLHLGTGLNHAFSGTWALTAGTLNGGSSTLDLSRAGTVGTTGGTFTANSGTVKYSFAGVQTVVPLLYNNLTLAGSGAKTTTSVTVNGVLSLEGSSTVTALPTYGASATLQYKGSAVQTTGPEFPSAWAGTGGVKIENASGLTLSEAKSIGTTPLTIGSSVAGSVFKDGGFLLTATGTLNLNSGSYIATYDNLPAFTTLNIASGTTVDYAKTGTQTIKSATYGNLTISGTGTNSKTADGNITVNGILNLSSSNASATQGCLDMSTYILHMGSAATTTGAGDVTGIISRSSFLANTVYDFGNQYTTITMAAGGTLPSQIQLKVDIGTAPSWKSNAVKRIYDITQTGGNSDTKASLALHYLDTELNSITEGTIDVFDYHTSNSALQDHGHSSYNTSNNWVSIDNFSISYLGQASFNDKLWTLGASTTVNRVWTGVTSTAWNTTTNWLGDIIPASGEIATIPDASTTTNDPTLPSSTTVGYLHVQTGGILNGGTGTTLTVDGGSGSWDNLGTFNAGTSTIVFTNAAATMTDPTNFYNVTVANGANLTLGLNNTMRIGGALTISGTGVLNATSNHNTVEFNANGNQTVVLPNGATTGYYNLILSGSGTKTLPASTLDVYGDLSFSGTASATASASINTVGNVSLGSGTSFDASTFTHTVSGNWTNNGATFTQGTGTVNFNSTSLDQSIDGTATSQTFNNISINKSGKTLSFGGSTSTVTLDGNLNIAAGTFDVGTALTLNLAGNLVNSGSFTAGSGTVNLNGATAQTVSGENTFHNLTITKASAGFGVSALANQTVNGILYLNSPNHSATVGALEMGAYTLSMLSASATVTGTGDVNGIIRRNHTFTPNTEYQFGNAKTTLSFQNTGTQSDEISCKVSIGTEAAYKTNAIHRVYQWAQTGSQTGTDKITAKMYYLDSELNSNTESKLVFWDHHTSTGSLHEHGRLTNDATNNWVNLSGLSVGYFAPTSLSSKEYYLADYTSTKNTWNGVGTNWSSVTSWSKNSIPTSTDDVLIPAGYSNYPTLSANSEVGTLEIESGAMLSASTFNLSVYGKGTVWNNAGTFNPGTGTVNFVHGVATDLLSTLGTTQFYNLYVGDNTYFVPSTGSITKISGSLSGAASSILNLSLFGTTVEYNGGNAQTVINPSTVGYSFSGYANLILSGDGAKTLSGNELSISGNLTLNSSFDMGSSSTVSFVGSTAQTISSTVVPTFQNLTVNNTIGVSSSSNLNVNGTLNLQSENPVSNDKGALDMISSSILSLGANSIISGAGDITGIVNRTHSFNTNQFYAFGNENTGVIFAAKSGQTLPSSITIRTTIGTAPNWSGTEPYIPGTTAYPSNPLKRLLNMAQSGGSGTDAIFRIHYKDNEIPSGVDESTLSVWSRAYVSSVWKGIEKGKSNQNVDLNYLTIQNVNFSNIPSVLAAFEITIAQSEEVYRTWVGGTSTSWTDTQNWLTAGVPASSDNLIIPNTNTTVYAPSIPVGAVCKSIIIKDQGVLNTLDGATLSVYGAGVAWVMEPGATFNAGNSTVSLNATTAGAMSMSGQTNFYNLTVTAGTTFRPSANNQIGISGSLANSGTLDAISNMNVIEYNANGNQTILDISTGYHDLKISGTGTKTLPSNLIMYGNFINNGTVDAGSGTISMQSAGHSTYISGSTSTSFYNLTISNTGQKVIAEQNLIVRNALNVSSGAEMDMVTYGLSDGNSGTPTISNSGKLSFSGVSNGFANSGGTVNYYGLAAQNIANGTYGNLEINNTNSATLSAGDVSTANLTVNSGAKLTVNAPRNVTVSTSLTNNGTITLNAGFDGAATILTPSTINGNNNVNVKLKLKTPKYSTNPRNGWYLSVPLTGATSGVFSPELLSTNPRVSYNRLWYLNEPTQAYVSISDNATSLQAGKGYVLSLDTYEGRPGEETFTFAGTLNTANTTIALSNTGTSSPNRGYNLIGNPYMGFLNWNLVDRTNKNISPTIWYRTPQSSGVYTYDYYNGSTGTGLGINGVVSQYIPPMQAFWTCVTADNTSPVISLSASYCTTANQTTNNTNLMRVKSATENALLRLRVTNGINQDETILSEYNLSANSMDVYDAVKVTNNNANVPEIYTFLDNKEIVINSMDNIGTNAAYALGFRPGKEGSFGIYAEDVSNFPNETRVYLKDNLLDKEFDLTDGSQYDFTATSTVDNQRFSIVFKTPTLTTELTNDFEFKAKVYANENRQIVINSNEIISTECNVFIYDISGNLILSDSISSNYSCINSNLKPGIYIVRLRSGNKEMNYKVLIP